MRGRVLVKVEVLILFRLPCNLEIVSYFEDSGNRIRADACGIFIALVDDHAKQRHIAILD
jgi:hypothetical protein